MFTARSLPRRLAIAMCKSTGPNGSKSMASARVPFVQAIELKAMLRG